MDTEQLKLSDGTPFEVKEITAGDIFDAIDEAKTVQYMRRTLPDGTVEEMPTFVPDNIKLERLLLLKSIKSFGTDAAEPTMEWLRSLNEADLHRVQNAVDAVDVATLKEVGNRGRDTAVS